MDGSWILLVVLLVLVCPVGMWLMMRGDHNHSRRGKSDVTQHRIKHEHPRDSGAH